ncbi:hypothetical protein [Psychrobacter frigidicola]|uniref:hypothetical protein n=1 Tax=Psychrobacter frigidicola TaxID=45611 RepID=UPI0019184BFA|nr:hypothetical protein [Psychrobacter frigidicola]
MKDSFELFPQLLKAESEGQRRTCLIKETTVSGESTEKELWFTYPAGLPMPEDDDCDSYLLAVLLAAMKSKADITIHGSVSRELLANLTELQYVWNKWLPKVYFLVDMKVEHIRENDTRVTGAVSAFSGGADAEFTAYRHATGKAGYGTQALCAGVFVHGFDIPLADTEGFSGAAQKASESLNDLGLSLFIVRTNQRELWSVNWEHYCGMAIASVLCGLSKYAGSGLIGSSETYDALFTPWGTHPMTDPLLSTGALKIIHDGAGFSRSEKIKTLSEWQVGIKNLRVCWVSDKHDRNCGICEKCVRNRLVFLLAGVSNPACFNAPLEVSVFKSISLRHEAVRMEWELIRSEMINTGKGVEWLPQVEQVLKRKAGPSLSFLFPPGSQRRKWVKTSLKRYRK